MAWLTNWNYRKAVTISNAGSVLLDYQVLATIDTATLVTALKMRSDCGDIRFTDTDGSTLLNYWIESGCNTASTNIWIKIPSVPIGTKTIYLYYGNSLVTTVSDGNTTFIQYMGISTAFLSPQIALPDNYIYEGLVRPAGTNRLLFSGVADSLTWGPQNGVIIGVYDFGNYNMIGNIKDGVSDLTNIAPAESITIYYRYKIIKTPSIVNFYVNNIFVDSATTNIPIANMGLALSNYRGSPDQQFSFIHKYASPEPIFGTTGTEELNITATNMILDTNTCTGSCQIIAGVTWQNLGSSSVTFTPAILIDNNIIAYATSNITIGPNPATGSSTITTHILSIGTHTICPYPN